MPGQALVGQLGDPSVRTLLDTGKISQNDQRDNLWLKTALSLDKHGIHQGLAWPRQDLAKPRTMVSHRKIPVTYIG